MLRPNAAMRFFSMPVWILVAACSDSSQTEENAPPKTLAYVDESYQIPFQVGTDDGGSSAFVNGISWFDYNNDGLIDLLVSNTDTTKSNGLFKNNGNGTFTDVAASVGLDGGNQEYVGSITADFNNDGLTDVVLIGAGGYINPKNPGQFYKNAIFKNNGNNTFTDVSVGSGLDTIIHSVTGLVAFDYDRDGKLDLFLCAPGDLLAPSTYDDRDSLLKGNGDFTFTDVSRAANVDSNAGAYQAIASDFDNDGWMDLVVANGNDAKLGGPLGFYVLPGPMELFHNNRDGTFTNTADLFSGLSNQYGFFMGIAGGDIENDGDMDYFVTNIGTGSGAGFEHLLLVNNGDGSFYPDYGAHHHAGQNGEIGWGATFDDYDNDGDQDLYYAGAGNFSPGLTLIGPGLASPGNMYLNDGRGVFAPRIVPVNVDDAVTAGVATADYDNDGRIDIAVATAQAKLGSRHISGQPRLLRNTEKNVGNYLKVRLKGTVSNRSAIGARVMVTVGDVTQTKEIYAGQSMLSQDSQWPQFGLGTNSAATSVRVRWPNGNEENFGEFQANQIVDLVEGRGR